MGFEPAMSKVEHIKHDGEPLEVWDRIARYAREGFGAISDEDIVRLRWFGIYQQKPNDGHFMWRIKLPGGRLTASQLREIGRLAHRYALGIGDITTRQDIQLHWLTIDQFPDAMDRIYNKVGLYTDFACGDTPRNITSCPLDGVLNGQMVELGDLVQKVSDMYRQGGEEFSNLPRKFKPSLGACPLHCHQPQINDIVFFGVERQRNGRREAGLGVVVWGRAVVEPALCSGVARVYSGGADARAGSGGISADFADFSGLGRVALQAGEGPLEVSCSRQGVAVDARRTGAAAGIHSGPR